MVRDVGHSKTHENVLVAKRKSSFNACFGALFGFIMDDIETLEFFFDKVYC